MNKTNTKVNVITKNWLYKLIAVLSAVVIWTFVTVSQNPMMEARYTVSVEVRGLANNLTMDNSDYQVNVRVQGTRAVISTLRAADIEAYANFAGRTAGEVTVNVVVEVPEDVNVISQSQNTITVELKEKRAELFPLEVDVIGDPAANYKTLQPVLSPAEVRLRGTDEYIRQVGRVYVVASIQDIEESLEKDFSIVVLDTEGKEITSMFTIEPRTAKVVIPVVYNQPEKTVAVRVPYSGIPALGYQLSLLSVTPTTVRVFGDIARLQALDYVETETLDITDMRYNESFTLNLNLGNGFTSDRKTVTVAVQIEPANYVSYSKTLLLAHNLGQDLAADVEQPQMQVTVYGPETFIATLNEADIVPYVDCSDLAEGEYVLPIRVSLPANIVLLNVAPDEAAVTIYADTPLTEEGENGIDEEQAQEGEEAENREQTNGL